MRRLFVTRAVLAEDEFDCVAVQILNSGIEAAAFIVAVTRGSTGSASSLESVGVALPYLCSIVCSKGYVCWCDSRTA
jgi:hypothetical protein